MLSFRSVFGFLFSDIVWKKVLAYGLLIAFGYVISDFLFLFFITFLFAYIFLEVGTQIAHKIHDWGMAGKPDRTHRLARKYATTNIVITILYTLFIGMVIFIFINIIPQIGNEVKGFLRDAPRIAMQGQDFVTKLEQSTGLQLGLDRMMSEVINPSNLENIGKKAFGYITNAGILLTKFLIALLLSYIFILDRGRVSKFLEQLRHGNFRFLYDEWSVIAKKMGQGFGMIFKAQSFIALANAFFTAIGLIIISLIHATGHGFPLLFTLSLIVFICGFIPVFGTFLSGVPIIILGYGYGGTNVVLACILMITIIHIIEAYYLNPKIVSSYMHFPIFITLVILLISEHLFGLIGLLIGVPLFSIIISIIEDIDRYIDKQKKKSTHTPLA